MLINCKTKMFIFLLLALLFNVVYSKAYLLSSEHKVSFQEYQIHIIYVVFMTTIQPRNAICPASVGLALRRPPGRTCRKYLLFASWNNVPYFLH